MKAKTKILLTSLMSVAFASSLIVGATYALFTSEAKVNIAVTSGTVKVDAKVNKASLVLTSMGEIQEGTTWANGGMASFTEEDELKLDYITPGDKATFTIDVTNESNVNIKYRVGYSVDGDLASVLNVTVDSLDDTLTSWSYTDEKEKEIFVSVELPESVDDEYQNKSATIAFRVEAVQANGAAALMTGVTVSGIAGYEDVLFASAQAAYDTISPIVDELAGLEQNSASVDAFNEVYSDNGKITWTIYGEQTVDNAYLFSFGRIASHYNDNADITNINIVGGNANAKLVMNSGVILPYNWWSETVPTVAVDIKNITLEKGTASSISFEPAWGYKFDLAFSNCNFYGSIHYLYNHMCELMFDGCHFYNVEGNTISYAVFVQGDETRDSLVTFNNNTFEGYDRGINLQRANTEFVVTGNTFINSKIDNKGVVQVTSGKKFTITGNTFESGVVGYAVLLHKLLKNSDVTISNNQVNSAKYLSDETTADANVSVTESQNKGTAIH